MQLFNDRKNILFISSWYPTEENPSAGIFIREHASAVSLFDSVVVIHLCNRNTAQLHLYSFTKDRNELLTAGINTYRFSVKSIPFLQPITFLIELYGIYRSIHYLIQSGFKPDIIHAHILRAGFIMTLLRGMFNCPIVITEHSSSFARRLLTKRDLLKARYAFNKADMVLPVSVSLQRAIEDYGIKANFRIVRNVVDPNLFFPDNLRKRDHHNIKLLFVGSLMPVKGVDFLINTLVDEPIKQICHLDIVGTGLLEKQYKQLCIDLGLAEKVTFHGLLHKKSIAQLMRRADLFVLPSLYESMPCVLIEAMASGLPVVASEVGGIPEIVDDRTGILCQPGDVNSLRNALIVAIDRLSEFDMFEIRYKTQSFSPESIGEQLHKVYLHLMKYNDGSDN